MIINIKSPNTEGRKSILRYYLDQVKHSDEIDVTRLALLTTGLYGSDLKSIVNFAAIKAVQDNDVEIDDSHLMFAYKKPKDGPEMAARKLNTAAKRAVAIHEAGHYLVGYLLNKEGLYFRKPAMATIIGRYSYLGVVSLQYDEKCGPAMRPLYSQEGFWNRLPTHTGDYFKLGYSQRSELACYMAGRAAEALFYGEENVHISASSDMKTARTMARSIVCNHSGHPDQIKGYQFGPINEWSEKTKELVDRLVGEEIDNAYKRATNMLRENSDLHNILIDALLKYESLDGPEIEMLLTTKSVSSVEEYRESLANERQKKWDELKFRQKIEESEKHQHRSK